MPLRIPSGDRTTVRLTAAVREQAAAGKTTLDIQLLRADGQPKYQQDAALEYLGNRRRVTVQAIEDTHAYQRPRPRTRGRVAALNVDGGDRQMGDHHHSVAFLKFRLRRGRPIDIGHPAVVQRGQSHREFRTDSHSGRIVEREVASRTNSDPNWATLSASSAGSPRTRSWSFRWMYRCRHVRELSLAIDPTGCDGVNYISREGGKPAELVIEYVDEGVVSWPAAAEATA